MQLIPMDNRQKSVAPEHLQIPPSKTEIFIYAFYVGISVYRFVHMWTESGCQLTLGNPTSGLKMLDQQTALRIIVAQEQTLSHETGLQVQTVQRGHRESPTHSGRISIH